ncbi:MAG TPA: zinc-ribbon domain-containing protein [Verrucomicrobiae bacterium]|jgi:hypothetical protein|nr:zinc-ribbon domain-containing protein [Verrucomicrobiae bacterium]
MPLETCPNCGAEIPSNARACPECGADERTGWSPAARYGGLDLPEEHFDYEEFVKSEFGGKEIVPRGISRFWWVIAVLVLAALAFFFWP